MVVPKSFDTFSRSWKIHCLKLIESTSINNPYYIIAVYVTAVNNRLYSYMKSQIRP